MKKGQKILWGIAAMTMILMPGISTEATSYATPNYEVKYYVDASEVLDSDYRLSDEISDEFDVESTMDMNVQYLDTDDLDLQDQGWAVRIRKKEDKKKFELTYKKRYTIVDGDIESALKEAAKDGFDSSEDDYEAQVDWGYSKQTLSFSDKKKYKDSSYEDLELPDLSDSLDEAIDEIPGKLNDWGTDDWGSDTLEDARIYGPVSATRYTGTFEGEDLDIEVWKILNEDQDDYDYVVEVSFKADDYSTASSMRQDLKTDLNSNGWLLDEDVLKTSMILDRY